MSCSGKIIILSIDTQLHLKSVIGWDGCGLEIGVTAVIHGHDSYDRDQKMLATPISTPNIDGSAFFRTNGLFLSVNRSLKTTVHCIDPLYNQSCVCTNIYYVNKTFLILIGKGRILLPLSLFYHLSSCIMLYI
jgi:hypothetical protein